MEAQWWGIFFAISVLLDQKTSRNENILGGVFYNNQVDTEDPSQGSRSFPQCGNYRMYTGHRRSPHSVEGRKHPLQGHSAVLRITLNIDGTPIASKSHTHPSHSQTSRLLTSSPPVGVPIPHSTQCIRDEYSDPSDLTLSLSSHRHSYRSILFDSRFISFHNKS